MNYDDIMKELEKYQSSHPTFVQLWTKYINDKKKSYEKSINTCFNLFDHLKDINDKDIHTVLFLYYLQLSLK